MVEGHGDGNGEITTSIAQRLLCDLVELLGGEKSLGRS